MIVLLACVTPDEGGPVATPDTPAVVFTVAHALPLTPAAEAAIARMPLWLQGDLRLALSQIDDGQQDNVADAIASVDDPALLDEVGFALAHISPEVLDGSNFHPQLVVENAELIYEVDPLLDYVELIEDGQPGVDADWSTTVRYQVETDGVVSTMDLDPELYYWYIVHPRIEDERPWYIDAWDECNRSTLECAADPETGTFWRRFLWDAAVETCPDGMVCPVVSDYLPGAATLYGAADGDDAVHRVAGMMLDSPGEVRWLSFGAYGERSIQPNRIYALGRGNCGEWADMTSAIARTALIANVNVTPSSWDHTWSAFYLDRWVAYEPVNWWFDYAYGSSYATFATRGDASMWYQTEQYNPNNGTLEVLVLDADDTPVDGATVALWSPYEDSWWYAGELVTDATGVARFTVGADLEFGWLVSSPLGGGTSLEGTIDGIVAGDTQQVTTRLDGSMPVAPAPETLGGGDVAVTVTPTVEGRLGGISYRLDDTSSQPTDAPTLTTMLLTHDQYDAYVAGDAFSAVDSFDAEGGVVVIANASTLGVSAIGTVDLTVSGGAEGTVSAPLTLLPGGFAAFEVGIE